MESDNKELVALDPEIITLGLSRDTAPKLILRITNISDAPIAFKVKTTQPTWYFVRPNLHVIEPKKTEEVAIVLIVEHCNRFIDMTEEERAEHLEKHRFLVQSIAITDHLYNKILSLPPNGRADDFLKLWESASKDEKKNQKLKVEFKMVDVVSEKPEESLPTPTVGENVEMIRNRISNLEKSSMKKQGDVVGSPDAIISELQSLRKKYDAVVEYTVHLTAERDYMSCQLEELRREYSREKSRKVSGSDVGSNMKHRSTEKSSDQKGEIQQGFTLLTLIIVAILSFVIARYTSAGSQSEL